MKSASYSESWLDLVVGSVKIERRYSSRSFFAGLFGYGWCSDFETKLDVLGTGQIKVTECATGTEQFYTPRDYDVANENQQRTDEIMAEVRKRRRDLSEQYLTQLRADMKSDRLLREECSKRLGLISWSSRLSYYSSDLRTIVTFDDRSYVRSFGAGDKRKSETFDLLGRLTSVQHANGDFLRLSYENNKLVSIISNDGNTIWLHYDQSTHSLSSIKASNGMEVSYKILDGNLVETKIGNDRFAYE